MSIRSTIAMKQKDNTYKSIYCHANGNLEYNGYILYNDYQDPTKVKLLMSLGDISVLGKYVFPDTTKEHNFDNRQDDVTVAYHRDRGERLHYEISITKEELVKKSMDYLYLFEDNKWKYGVIDLDKTNAEFIDLEDALLEKNIIDIPQNNNNVYLDELVTRIVQYSKDFDPYEFQDSYDNEEIAFEDTKKHLQTVSGAYDIIDALCNDIHYFTSENDLSNHDINDLYKEATNLLVELNQYLKTLEKDKEMDI